MSAVVTHTTRGPAGTERAGAALAGWVWAGARVGLEGSLGAGKTAFVRGFVRALDGGRDAPVASPTFALCLVYPTSPPVAHLDAWRLESRDDLESIGFWEIDPNAVVLMEWASRLPASALDLDVEVRLEAVGASSRRIALRCVSERAAAAVAARGPGFNPLRDQTDGRSRGR